MNQRDYQTLILAGLLHDVGKLLIKDPAERERSRELSNDGSSNHWIIGEDLLRRDGIGEQLARFNIDFDKLCFAVRWHHHYTERDEATHALGARGDQAEAYEAFRDTVSDADGLSAGERVRDEESDIDYALALQPIFAGLELGRQPQGRSLRYLPHVLTPVRAFPGEFPTGDADEARRYRAEAYTPLVEDFEEGFHYAVHHAHNLRELEHWVYSLLERYAWAVPGDMRKHMEPRDVSLFDHERTTCAIGAALALYRALGGAGRTFLLVKADISGVQDYIYTVANVGPGGVAKRLRARSFFVTALTETVSHRLLEELVPGYRLPVAAKIMAGGGQFVLLAPNLHAVHQRLAAIERDVNQWLWDEFQGDLAVVFGTTTAGQKHLAVKPGQARTVCDVLDELERNTRAAKDRRLGSILRDGEGSWDESAFKWEAKPYPHGDCPSCTHLPARAGEEAQVDQRLCARCHQDRLLSERIVEARYVAYFQGAVPIAVDQRWQGWLNRSTLTLFDGDDTRYVVLLDELGDLKRLDRRPYQLDGFGYETPTPEGPALVRHFANYVPRFESLEELATFCTAERACIYGRYTDDDTCGILVRPDGSYVQADHFPILQTFGCLSAAAAEQARPESETLYGSQLLGVLRADMDNLGLLFRRGLGDVKSLSRVATLSRMTDLFFSGWVNENLKNPPEGSDFDRIYTVYAGGDDLCLVGPWDTIIDFTQTMAEAFRRYTAGTPNVTLSAAVSVTKPKFPIATSARRAGELLQAAKDAGRNRVNLFGVIARWSESPDKWVDLSEDTKRQLDAQRAHAKLLWRDLWQWAALLEEELGRWREAEVARYPISASFAHRLLEYGEMARRWEQEQEISAEDMLYLARLSYDLARNVVASDAVPEETKRRLSRLTQLSNRRMMAGMRLPITYALHRNRERSPER